VAEESKRNWLSITIKTLVFLMILLLFFVCILHIPSVQKKIAQFAANQVVDASQGDLTFESATFDLNKGVTIKLSPRSTLLSLISEVSFSDVNITGVAIHVRRHSGEELNNWQRFLNGFQSSGDDNTEPVERKAFPFTHFELYDLELNYTDEVDSLSIIGQFAALETKFNLVRGGHIDIDFINLIEPYFHVRGPMMKNGVQPEDRTESDPVSVSTMVLNQLNILDGKIDYRADQSLTADHIDLVMSDIEFMNPQTWKAIIQDLSLETKGYDIKHISSSQVISSPDNIRIEDFFARVNNSYFKADLDAQDIYSIKRIDDVSLDLDLSESKILPSDFVRLIDNLPDE